ncbi:MAG: pyruvate dehydrogenase E1 component subunit beta [Parcubacteria group bacterium Gr01-1014_20]|nr:MAG: pyruvate dehydrogenase E1 component subunit beta [Parcubacteria group bacterium Gr01-1014_20]
MEQLRYKSELTRAMLYLAENPSTLFIGQSVAFPGNSIFKTIENVPLEKRIELPVFEETQMGMSIGLALAGYIPISIYPRFNFLLLALNQLVNHLDKIPVITNGKVWPKVIIKTAIGSERPLFPGVQHSGDFTEAMRLLVKNIEVVRLDTPEQIFPEYEKAINRPDGKSTLLVEYGDYYNEK